MRDDLNTEWSFPKQTHSIDALLWDQTQGDYWERHRVAKRDRVLSARSLARSRHLEDKPSEDSWRTVRDAIEGLPDAEKNPGAAKHFLNPRQQFVPRSYPGHPGSPVAEAAMTLKEGSHRVPVGGSMLLSGAG